LGLRLELSPEVGLDRDSAILGAFLLVLITTTLLLIIIVNSVGVSDELNTLIIECV